MLLNLTNDLLFIYFSFYVIFSFSTFSFLYAVARIASNIFIYVYRFTFHFFIGALSTVAANVIHCVPNGTLHLWFIPLSTNILSLTGQIATLFITTAISINLTDAKIFTKQSDLQLHRRIMSYFEKRRCIKGKDEHLTLI